jgi:hypothetical protein
MRAQSASVENDLGNGRHIAMSISSPGGYQLFLRGRLSFLVLYFGSVTVRQEQID